MWSNLFRSSRLVLLVSATTMLGCADRSPTAPIATQPEINADAAAMKGRPGAQLTGAVDETVNGVDIVGTVRITEFAVDPVTGRLAALGVLSGTANGEAFTQAFGPVPATLSKGAAAAVQGDATALAVGSCDILLLDLGPLHLDLLGLEVDLARVILDIDAQAGAGNLLGNLLCAVVSLLDGPGLLASIAGILEQINTILAAF
jgi:hypothetical protein